MNGKRLFTMHRLPCTISSSKEAGLALSKSGSLQKEDSKIFRFKPVHYLRKFQKLSQREVSMKRKVLRGPKIGVGNSTSLQGY